jgi:hypothetical protein
MAIYCQNPVRSGTSGRAGTGEYDSLMRLIPRQDNKKTYCDSPLNSQ